MEKVLKVQGMSCAHCVRSVEESVGELEGISTVEVNLDRGEVTVDFDQQVVTLDQVKETIEDQGYDVV